MPLRVFFKGHQYEGEYEVEGSIVWVFFEGRSKAKDDDHKPRVGSAPTFSRAAWEPLDITP